MRREEERVREAEAARLREHDRRLQLEQLHLQREEEQQRREEARAAREEERLIRAEERREQRRAEERRRVAEERREQRQWAMMQQMIASAARGSFAAGVTVNTSIPPAPASPAVSTQSECSQSERSDAGGR